MTTTNRLRLALKGTTALAAALMFAVPALAQSVPSIPDTGNVTVSTRGLGGAVPGSTNPTFTPTQTQTGTDLRVDLRDNRTILNWGGNGFNIAQGSSVNFTDARATAGVTNRVDNIAVLNRDLSGSRSSILGSLKSDANVGVYVINTNGILMGTSTTINTGSFLASTSNITVDNDFLNANSSLRFVAPSERAEIDLAGASITTQNNGRTSGGRMGDLVLVGTRVKLGESGSAATLTAGSDFALVTSRDVTIRNSPGSPLSIVISAGALTSDADNWALVDGYANIAGSNVTVAGALQGQRGDGASSSAGVRINGMMTATGAAQTDRGVVLTFGKAAAGVDLASSPSESVDAKIGLQGTISHSAAEGGIGITSARNLYMAAADGIELDGAQIAGRAEFITDGTMVFSGARAIEASDLKFGARKALLRGDITASAGDITFAAGTETELGTAGLDPISVTASGTIGGDNIDSLYGNYKFNANLMLLSGRYISVGSGYLDGGAFIRGIGTGPGNGVVNIYGTMESPRSIALEGSAITGGGNIFSGFAMTAYASYIELGDMTGWSIELLSSGLVTTGSMTTTMGGVSIRAGQLTSKDKVVSIDVPGTVDIEITGRSGTSTIGSIGATGNITFTSNSTGDTSFGDVRSDADIKMNFVAGGVAMNSLSSGGGAIISGRNVSIATFSRAGAGSIAFTSSDAGFVEVGEVTASNHISLNGGAVGISGDVVAGGKLDISARNGGISVRKPVMLQSDSDGMGGEALSLYATGAYDLDPGSLLSGGLRRGSDIYIRYGAGQALLLGKIEGRNLWAPNINGVLDNRLQTSNDIRVGSIDLLGSIWLQGRSVIADGPINSAQGTVNLWSDTSLTVKDSIAAYNSVTLVGGNGGILLKSANPDAAITSNKIILSTSGTLTNDFGADALNETLNWVIFLTDPSKMIGFVDSKNTAIWGSSPNNLPPSMVLDNRYVFAEAPGTLTFTPTAISKVYGTDLTGSTLLYSVSGFRPGLEGAYLGDTAATALAGSPLVSSNGLIARAGVSGSPYSTSLSQGSLVSSGGYNLIFDNSTLGSITVTPKALNLGYVVDSKVYDGSSAATGTVTIDGIVQGDSVSATGTIFSFTDKNAGTGKTVSVSGTALTGADAGNYSFVLPTGATIADIYRKSITAAITANSKTYDGTTAAAGTLTLAGLIQGDNVASTDTIFSFADKNAGVGKTVTAGGTTLTGTDVGNYELGAVGTAIADIYRKSITAEITANSKTYDGTTAATGALTLAGLVQGDDLGTTGSVFSFADKNAGTGKSVSVTGTTLTGADAGNYSFIAPTGTTVADIYRKSITAAITANGKTYDGTTSATGTLTLTGLIRGDSVGTTSTVFTFADKNAGIDKTVFLTGTSLVGGDSGNYDLVVPATTTATIFQKAIWGSYIVDNKVYDGTTAATGRVVFDGVIAGDDLGATGSVFTFSDKNARLGKTVIITGTTITGDAGNYSITLPQFAVADILQRSLTAAIVANSKTYDGTTAATGTLTLAGLVQGDSVGTADTVFSFADKNAGTGKTVTAGGTTLTGADAGNYELGDIGTGTADIFRKAITGSITAYDKVYDGITQTSGYVTLTGVVDGDMVNPDGSIWNFTDKNAGVGKTVTVEGTRLSGDDADNYTLTLTGTSTTATILRRQVGATVTADSKVYDGTTAATGTIDLWDVIEGDQLGTTGTVWTFTDKNAGARRTVLVSGTTLTGADAGNYSLGLASSTFASITRKALNMVVQADSKTYDGTTAATGMVTLDGVVSGETVGLTGTSLRFADRNAGTGKTVIVSGGMLTGVDSGNYTLGLPVNAVADILRKAVTVSVTVNGKTYDGTTAATGTVSFDGAIQGDDVGITGTSFAFADKNAGTGKAVTVTGTSLTGADAGNYALSMPETVVGDIFRRAITGSVTANGKTYDGTTTGSGTVTLDGVLQGDQVGTTGTVWTFSDKNAGTGKVVTISGTTLNGVDGGNYTVTLPASALADILKKAITGTVTVTSRQYDGTTDASGTVGLNGVVQGDQVGTTGTVLRFADANAGTGKAVGVSGTALNGADAGNYTLTMPAVAVGDILKRAISVKADDASKIRDEEDPLLTFTLVSGTLVAGDQFTGDLTRAPGERPGRYAISIGSLNLGGNYEIAFTPGTFTINLDPASDLLPPTLRALFLPSQIQADPNGGGAKITIDRDALCGEDTSCTVH